MNHEEELISTEEETLLPQDSGQASEQSPEQIELTPEESLEQAPEEIEPVPEENLEQTPEESPQTPEYILETAPVPVAAPRPAPELPRQEQRERRKASPAFRATVIIGLSILLIMGISMVAQLFTLYEVRLTSSGVELVPRIRAEDIVQAPDLGRDTPPSPSPALPPENGDDNEQPPDNGSDVPSIPDVVLGSGATLELHPIPSYDETGASPRLSFQEIFQRCSPSVVLIEAHLRFGAGSGTGVIMTADGYIITAAHVIEDAREITVTLEDGARYYAALVGMDMNTDIAVLRIDAQGLIPAEFGNSDLLQVGEEVAVIGNPLGHLHTMSNGIISALDRDIIYDGITMRLIQTNAAINEGNSGGPLINRYGQVVGITNMKLVGQDHRGFSTVEGMGFAVPTAVMRPVVDSIIAYGRVVGRPALGIVVQLIDTREANEQGITPGVYVQRVLEGTDAHAQGLQIGDRIVSANGSPLATSADLRNEIQTFRAGETIAITIERDGEVQELYIRLMDAETLEF